MPELGTAEYVLVFNTSQVSKMKAAEGQVVAATDGIEASVAKAEKSIATMGESVGVTAKQNVAEEAKIMTSNRELAASYKATAAAATKGSDEQIAATRLYKKAAIAGGMEATVANESAWTRLSGTIKKHASLSSPGTLIGLGAAYEVVKQGVKWIDEANKGWVQLNTVIKSTHGVAGVSAQDASKLADYWEKTTGAARGTTLQTESMLLSFKNIRDVGPGAGLIYDRTLTAIENVSARTGRSIQTVAIQIGKAVSDPTKYLTSLSRAGITFTKVQTDMVKQLAETKGTVAAQNYVLLQLQDRYGGAAVAAGKTLSGQLAIARASLDAASASIVQGLLPAFRMFVTLIKQAANFIRAHTTAVRDLLIAFLAYKVLMIATNGVINLYKAATTGAKVATDLFKGAMWLAKGTATLLQKAIGVIGPTSKTAAAQTETSMGAIDTAEAGTKRETGQLQLALEGLGPAADKGAAGVEGAMTAIDASVTGTTGEVDTLGTSIEAIGPEAATMGAEAGAGFTAMLGPIGLVAAGVLLVATHMKQIQNFGNKIFGTPTSGITGFLNSGLDAIGLGSAGPNIKTPSDFATALVQNKGGIVHDALTKILGQMKTTDPKQYAEITRLMWQDQHPAYMAQLATRTGKHLAGKRAKTAAQWAAMLNPETYIQELLKKYHITQKNKRKYAAAPPNVAAGNAAIQSPELQKLVTTYNLATTPATQRKALLAEKAWYAAVIANKSTSVADREKFSGKLRSINSALASLDKKNTAAATHAVAAAAKAQRNLIKALVALPDAMAQAQLVAARTSPTKDAAILLREEKLLEARLPGTTGPVRTALQKAITSYAVKYAAAMRKAVALASKTSSAAARIATDKQLLGLGPAPSVAGMVFLQHEQATYKAEADGLRKRIKAAGSNVMLTAPLWTQLLAVTSKLTANGKKQETLKAKTVSDAAKVKLDKALLSGDTLAIAGIQTAALKTEMRGYSVEIMGLKARIKAAGNQVTVTAPLYSSLLTATSRLASLRSKMLKSESTPSYAAQIAADKQLIANNVLGTAKANQTALQGRVDAYQIEEDALKKQAELAGTHTATAATLWRKILMLDNKVVKLQNSLVTNFQLILGGEPAALRLAQQKAAVSGTQKDALASLLIEKTWLQGLVANKKLSLAQHNKYLADLTTVLARIQEARRKIEGSLSAEQQQVQSAMNESGTFFSQFAGSVFGKTAAGLTLQTPDVAVNMNGASQAPNKTLHYHQNNTFHQIPDDRHKLSRQMREAADSAMAYTG